jgi:phage baseplate assembly protein gpV
MEARLTMKAPRPPFASTLTFRLALGALAAAVTLAACDDSDKDVPDAGDAARPDGPSADAAPGEVATDVATGDAAGGGDDSKPDAVGTPFALLVTESPPGPSNGDRANWGGVKQYTAAGSGATLAETTGIPAAMLADPAGLAYRASSGEVFVGNRHGNNSADGTAGSIVRFRYDRQNRSFTMTGTITGNGLSGVHGLTFSPTTGELFAANYVGCVSRFTFDGTGAAMPKGTLGSGTCRGVRVSADGRRLYVTSAAALIKVFDLMTGVEAPSVNVADSPSLHGLAWQGGTLYAAGLTNNKIHRFLIDLAGNPQQRDTITASSPAAIDFSADGMEMFTAGHRDSDILQRFRYDAIGDKWTASADVSAQKSLGDVLVLP